MKKSILKRIGIVFIVGILIAGGIVYYLFNKPHRDVQATAIDYNVTSTEIVSQYLDNVDNANDKYLSEEGTSKIIAVTGTVVSITSDQKNQKVVLLKGANDKAGVSCTFMESTNANASKLKVEQTITVKGVIRSGAGFDEDLEMYEDVILEKCDVLNQ